VLLLFDIDGTLLVRAAGAHREALHAAVREVHRVDIPDAFVATAGRTDLAIMRSILTLAGVDARALVTGNLEPIARLKLRRAGLGEWFSKGPGGFGSDHEDRSELPALARRRAAVMADGEGSAPVRRAQTVVIGDTPLDIACARADGVRCVAVTTGPHGAADLGDADAVIDRMADLQAVLDGWT
jgi:phosphoglycolate phosphatase